MQANSLTQSQVLESISVPVLDILASYLNEPLTKLSDELDWKYHGDIWLEHHSPVGVILVKFYAEDPEVVRSTEAFHANDVHKTTNGGKLKYKHILMRILKYMQDNNISQTFNATDDPCAAFAKYMALLSANIVQFYKKKAPLIEDVILCYTSNDEVNKSDFILYIDGYINKQVFAEFVIKVPQ